MMMIQWWIIIFFLIKFYSIDSIENKCNYLVTKSDNTTNRCFANQCYQYLNLLSIMVEPSTCKTSSLLLSFSSYQNFILFRNKLKWKLGNLFSSELINQNRQFILFVDQLDYNDKPFDHDELIQLGINIDFYTLFIRNILNKNYLVGSIHYDPTNTEWNIIKIKFRCLKLSAFDRYPCSSEIISPPLFALQRPSSTTTTFQSISSSFLSSTKESSRKSNEKKRKSIDLILIIIIPFIIIIISIYIIKKYCFNRDILSTSESSSRTNISNHSIDNQRNSSLSSVSDNTIVPQNRFDIDQVQNRITYDNHHHIKTDSAKNHDNNYEKVRVDAISVIGQQHFVPISSSVHF